MGTPKTPVILLTAPNHFLTRKQMELMDIIHKRNKDGSPVDLDQILERLSYETSKESLQFSIRALLGRGMIQKMMSEKRRGRCRRSVECTVQGNQFMEAGVSIPEPKSMIESPEETEIIDQIKALESAVFGLGD